MQQMVAPPLQRIVAVMAKRNVVVGGVQQSAAPLVVLAWFGVWL